MQVALKDFTTYAEYASITGIDYDFTCITAAGDGPVRAIISSPDSFPVAIHKQSPLPVFKANRAYCHHQAICSHAPGTHTGQPGHRYENGLTLLPGTGSTHTYRDVALTTPNQF